MAEDDESDAYDGNDDIVANTKRSLDGEALPKQKRSEQGEDG